MNFAVHSRCVLSGGLFHFIGILCICLPGILILGCSDNVQLPTHEELAAFNKAGPILPEIDVEALLRVRSVPREYRARTGDILAVRIPPSLLAVTPDEDTYLKSSSTPDLLCRVDDAGTINLPIVGQVQVAGKKPIEIESEIVRAYYPRYAVNRPTVVVKVSEYDTSRIVITGAVKNPGVYELPKDRMTLVSAIMAAGGISETGSGAIRIHYPVGSGAGTPPPAPTDAQHARSLDKMTLTFQQRAKQGLGTLMLKEDGRLVYAEDMDVTVESERSAVADRISRAYPELSNEYVLHRLCELANAIEPGSVDPALLARTPGQVAAAGRSPLAGREDRSLLLPIKGASIPFADVALRDEATIEVEPLDPEVFTVMGLVARPGVFPYPTGAKYNLLQAISFAGGVNEVADPRYVRVYRQNGKGEIVDAAFAIQGSVPISASTLLLKPGDVVAVEQTPRTHFNTLMNSMVGIRFGAGYFPNYGD
jgi:protein involved in polysaccharide export with SLBB domain